MINNNKNYKINSSIKSFLIGMIVAIFLIAGLLWYLNNTNEFIEQDKLNKTSKPTILSLPDFKHKDDNTNDEEMNKIIKNIEVVQYKNMEAIDKDMEAVDKNTSNTINSNIAPTKNISKDKSNTLENTIQDITLENNNNTQYSQSYNLQIGAFSQKEKAKSQVVQLTLLNIPVKIKKIITNNHEYFKVLYPNISYNKAISIQKLLQKNKINSMIIKN